MVESAESEEVQHDVDDDAVVDVDQHQVAADAFVAVTDRSRRKIGEDRLRHRVYGDFARKRLADRPLARLAGGHAAVVLLRKAGRATLAATVVLDVVAAHVLAMPIVE